VFKIWFPVTGGRLASLLLRGDKSGGRRGFAKRGGKMGEYWEVCTSRIFVEENVGLGWRSRGQHCRKGW